MGFDDGGEEGVLWDIGDGQELVLKTEGGQNKPLGGGGLEERRGEEEEGRARGRGGGRRGEAEEEEWGGEAGEANVMWDTGEDVLIMPMKGQVQGLDDAFDYDTVRQPQPQTPNPLHRRFTGPPTGFTSKP